MNTSVSWVYQLPKTALVETTKTLGMNSVGNLDQLRRLVIEHLRTLGKTDAIDGGPSTSPGTLLPAPTNTAMDRIRKWGEQTGSHGQISSPTSGISSSPSTKKS